MKYLRGNKKDRVFIAVLFLICFFALWAPLSSYAAVSLPNITVVSDIDFAHVMRKLDRPIDNFSAASAVHRWQTGPNVSFISAENSFFVYPYSAFEGNYFLKADSTNASPGSWRYVDRIFDTPLNLSRCTTLFYAVNVPYIENVVFLTTAKLYSGSSVVAEASAEIKSESWNGVFLDISGREGLDQITQIRIGVRCSFPNGTAAFQDVAQIQYSFALDYVYATSYTNPAVAAKFLSGKYEYSGGRLSYADRLSYINYTLESSALSPVITSDVLESDLFEHANAIKIELQNRTECRTVMLEYTSDPDFLLVGNAPVTIELAQGEAMQTLYFPVNTGDGEIKRIRLTFNDALNGEIDIYSITPASWYSPFSAAYGNITECKLSDTAAEIVISGTLNANTASTFKNGKIALYELEAWQDSAIVLTDVTEPIVQKSVSETFAFTIPLYDGARSRICSRFAVVLQEGTRAILIDDAQYLANPEQAGTAAWPYPQTKIKKGLDGQYDIAQLLGAGNASVTLRLDQLASLSSGYPYEFEGSTYYADRDTLALLDAQIQSAYAGAMNVTLILTLGVPQDDRLKNILVHPDYNFTAFDAQMPPDTVPYAAFNTESAEGIKYLRSLCNFLADRYMGDDDSYGRVVNIVVGSGINTAYLNYNMGAKNLSDFVDSYAKAFRIVYNTVRSVAPKARVYISLDSVWTESSPILSYKFCSRDILDVFSEKIKAEGGLAWHLAFDLTPNGAHLAYQSGAYQKNGVQRVTAATLTELCDYMKRARLTLDGVSRMITVFDTRPVISQEQLVEFIYTSYMLNTASCAAVEGFIASSSPSETDFYTVFKYINTEKTMDYTSFALQLMGASAWNEKITGFDITAIFKSKIQNAKITDVLPEHIVGNAQLWSFTDVGDTEGWVLIPCGSQISGANDFKGYKNMLFAQHTPDVPLTYASGANIGITNKFSYARDLSIAPYLYFMLYVDGIADHTTPLSFSVIAYSGASSIEFSATMKAGSWKYVVCDISSFEFLKTVDRLSIWVHSADTVDLTGATMVVSPITAHSLKYNDDYLSDAFEAERTKYLAPHKTSVNYTLVYSLAVVIICAMTIETIYVLSRVKAVRDDKMKRRRR